MGKNRQTDKLKRTDSQKSRPTIGMLADDLDNQYQHPILNGVLDAAEARDVNLLCFSGRLHRGLEAQDNKIYHLGSTATIDGLVVISDSLGNHVTPEEYSRFLKSYSPLPIVGIGREVEGNYSILVDQVQGLRDLLTHLIENHGYRRIAFIRGPDASLVSEVRYGVYCEVLAENGLEVDPDLVTSGDFQVASGAAAISLFLDERKADFEAVMAANDNMALGALEALQARGIRVPDDVAVAGFDDVEQGEIITPPLTTVKQPLYEQGRQAVEVLVDLLAGKEMPQQMTLPSEMVVRQSCGCLSQAIMQIPMDVMRPTDEAFEVAFASQRDHILSAMAQVMENPVRSETRDRIGQLLDAFAAEVKGQSPDIFLPALNDVLRQVMAEDGNVAMWQRALSVLQHMALPTLSQDGQALLLANKLWQQARILIADITQRGEAYEMLQAEQRVNVLNEINQALVTTFDVAKLMNTVAQELPRLNIPRSYLALYEGKEAHPEWSKLALAYDEQGRVALDPETQRFPTCQLIPAGLWPQGRRYTFMVEPLYFQDNALGFVLFEAGPRHGQVYETLRGQISSALQGALLMEQEEKRVRQLQTVAEVSAATSTILDTGDLLQQVVDLTKERFDLYHAHIYLLNEVGDTLDLTAGAGEKGRKMVAEGWSIPLDRKQSLVAQAARNRRGEVANDVQAASNWFANPYLPDTRSELAVPLIVGDRMLGVLDVQSAEVNYFTDDDVRIQSTLAVQVAVALENARLFEETTQSKEEAELAKERAEQARAEAEQAQKEIEVANQTLETQMWQRTGQTQLSDKMQGEQDISTLANNVVQQLCQYLGSQIGMLYITEDDSLNLVGGYAYSNNNSAKQFKFGEGLVGQAALQKQPIIIDNVSDDHITIRSGLVETLPKTVMIFPFRYEDQVVGVIELGTLTEYTQAQKDFMQTALDTIAIAFNTAQARERINELLAETQQQAEELQAQGEELRVANEELAAQTESLRASEAKLKEKQTELEATNTQLEEKAAALEKSSVALQEQQATLDQQNQELKEAQQELEKRAQELALASQYKSEFLANMSHELRTPLNSLLILAHMLAENKEENLTEEQVESAQIMYSGGTDLLNLINDILDLSKVEAGQMIFTFESMPLTDLVSTMRIHFDHLAQGKGLEFNINLAEDLPGRIKTDQQRVKQIVKNLLSNAFKFTSQGSVSLNFYRPGNKVDLSRSGLDPSQAIAISVVDTGIGMMQEQLEVIFEAFQQADGSTNRQYGGTGLGLSISRELSAKLGGQIEVESEVGKGSTFTLYLPIEQPTDEEKTTTAPSEKETPQPVSPLPANPSAPVRPFLTDDRDQLGDDDKLLMVIEDDAKFAKIMVEYAHKKDFKCLAANDGRTGLELVKSYQPHAIILDLNLPDISGWEVLAILKNDPATRHIPVHIMSVDEEVLDAYRRGAMGYLTKPVSQETLDVAFEKIEGLISRQIKTLLLVEDDANSRRSIKKLLNGSDVQINEAERGQTALELLRTQPFDCMILDLSLPDMSGFDILNKINEDETIARCPVIVYTGRELTPEENEELMQYADSVIVKGVKSPERLLDETALFLHRVVAEMPVDKQQTIQQLYNRDDLLQGKRVMIVDDDMRNSFALSKLLSDKGILVKIARDGQKALEMLAEDGEIDLILMDIMMPVLDGYETTKRIRAQQRFNSLPILALTAKAMKGDREKCLAAGANDYLPKPVDVDRLFSMLRVWLYQ